MKTSNFFLIVFIGIALFAISCSTSDDALLQEEENLLVTEEMSIEESEGVSANSRIAVDTAACTYFNANPFTVQTETFLCGDPNPNPAPKPQLKTLDRTAVAQVSCFPSLLKAYVPNDFEDQILDGTTFVQEFDTSFSYGSEFLYFSERGVPENACLYPYIQPNHANILFRSVSCEIQDYFDTLPTLPSNQFYYPEITYLFTDFLFSGPHSTSSFVEFGVDVKIWEVN